jgi:mannosyl-3-phosphoglycerate phosphatase
MFPGSGPSRPALVFASIDGRPLVIDEGHRRLPALLAALAAERIFIVFCSARTRAEMEGFRQSIGIFHPFICEDGAAAFVPARYFGSDLQNARHAGGYQAIEFAPAYDAATTAVRRAAAHLRIPVRQFADMSIEEVARDCGLSLLDARLAKLREYGEPFRLVRATPDAERRFRRALSGSGMHCSRHGTFFHATWVDGPRAAIAVLRTLYRTSFGMVITASTGFSDEDTGGDAVQVNLDAVRLPEAPVPDAVGWIEAIVARVRNVRDAGVSRPVVAAERMGA